MPGINWTYTIGPEEVDWIEVANRLFDKLPNLAEIHTQHVVGESLRKLLEWILENQSESSYTLKEWSNFLIEQLPGLEEYYREAEVAEAVTELFNSLPRKHL